MPRQLARHLIPPPGLWMALGTAALFAIPFEAMGDGSEDELVPPSQPACSERYPLVASPSPTRDHRTAKEVVRENFDSARDWGTEDNIKLLTSDVTDLGETGLRILYPENTSSPSDADDSDDAGRGGAGFYTEESALATSDRACLQYRVRFEPGFDFVKGGKLPGLYGGDAPSGGDDVDGENGFSMRFMWREEGQGELYPYVVGREGDSIGQGMWHFPTGQWVTLEQEVILNTPEEANGLARVWVDGEPILELQNLVYRTTEDVTIDGLMFSSFFGGTGEEWRSPRDQSVDFSAFRIYAPQQ